jgi:hypothetical protein
MFEDTHAAVTEACVPLMDKDMREAYAQHMARAPKGTTVVDPTSMPSDEDMFSPKEKLLNLPTTLEEAISRIRAVETALDDLNRASEIAQYSGQFEILGSFRDVADAILATKITVDHSKPTEMNITIVG